MAAFAFDKEAKVRHVESVPIRSVQAFGIPIARAFCNSVNSWLLGMFHVEHLSRNQELQEFGMRNLVR